MTAGGRKIRVGVLFGGRSGEHEVSLMSAASILAAIDRERFEPVPIGITRTGQWLLGGDPLKALDAGVEAAGGRLLMLGADPERPAWSAEGAPPSRSAEEPRASSAGNAAQAALVASPAAAEAPFDVVFPVLHGTFGEDGTVQGLLELANIPYVGSGVLGSAVGMDKWVAKQLFRQAGLDTAEALLVTRASRGPDLAAAVFERLGYPCFVKPCNLGSSVGVSKVADATGLDAAMDLAFQYDRRVIIERAVNAREIEVSVLGNDHAIASVPGEVVPRHEFYDYEAKYIDEHGAELIIPADLPETLVTRLREAAVTAFHALDLAGLARVDFFLERGNDRILVNEVNTIPGFTRISMYPKLWEASGISYRELISRLIELAVERHAERNRLRTDYRPS